MKIHAIEAGRLLGNKTVMRGTGSLAILRRRVNYEFPAYVYIIEHPAGLVAIDTGMSARGWKHPFPMSRGFPSPIIESEEEEIGPRMRARGLGPEDVRTVVITHLDVDHVGGARWFPKAEVLVHRPDWEFASTFMGKVRYRSHRWPWDFEPNVYDLEPKPYGPFPQSKLLKEYGNLHLVPLPGHSPGQVGVMFRLDGLAYFFTADHVLRQDWFVEDWAAGRLLGLGQFFPEDAVETSRRIHRFTEEMSTVLLPAHDIDAVRRLEETETIQFGEERG